MLKMLRRSFLAGTAALVALPIVTFAQSPVAQKGGSLRVAVDQAATTIHPMLTRVNPEHLFGELVYSGLTRLTLEMLPEPDLALSWETSEDLKTWTFVLRQGVLFHDGTPFDAADVVASFKAVLDETNASPARTNVGPISDVVALDDHTVQFQLSAPYADLPSAVAHQNARIIPAEFASSDFAALSQKSVGTGPFKLVSYEPDRLVVVERNGQYYDPERPHLDSVELHVFPDVSAAGSALISGTIDLIAAVEPTEYLRMDGQAGVDVLRTATGQFCNINFGCDTAPFNDPRVRRALALTVDRQAMVDFVTEGLGSAGNDTPLNASYPFFAEIPKREANIEQAKALLAEAGMPDGFEATLIASDRPAYRTQLAIALKEMAKAAGITINVETMPHATYLDQVWKKGNFYVGFYAMYPTPDGIFKQLYTSDAAWNETRWNNAAFDAVIAEARSTVDSGARTALYTQAQEMMNEEVPSIIPTFFDALAAKRSWVQGYDVHPRVTLWRLDYAYLAEDAPGRAS